MLEFKHTLPTIAELFEDNLQTAYKNEQLNLLLNQEPPAKWIKEHPYIRNYKYIPIDKIEYLLRKIFKVFNIEILREGTAFNGVYCVVRVHYLNPIDNIMHYHDGIGACQLQTKQGTSASDLININNGAISMAFPIAKTVAVKDACDHFGKLFGCDLNRKDTIPFDIDKSITTSVEKQRVIDFINNATSIEQLNQITADSTQREALLHKHNLTSMYEDKLNELNKY